MILLTKKKNDTFDFWEYTYFFMVLGKLLYFFFFEVGKLWYLIASCDTNKLIILNCKLWCKQINTGLFLAPVLTPVSSKNDAQLQTVIQINYIFPCFFNFLMYEWKSHGISLGQKLILTMTYFTNWFGPSIVPIMRRPVYQLLYSKAFSVHRTSCNPEQPSQCFHQLE
jgi:hypothetical protein